MDIVEPSVTKSQSDKFDTEPSSRRSPPHDNPLPRRTNARIEIELPSAAKSKVLSVLPPVDTDLKLSVEPIFVCSRIETAPLARAAAYKLIVDAILATVRNDNELPMVIVPAIDGLAPLFEHSRANERKDKALPITAKLRTEVVFIICTLPKLTPDPRRAKFRKDSVDTSDVKSRIERLAAPLVAPLSDKELPN
jgi:hypothetical protein